MVPDCLQLTILTNGGRPGRNPHVCILPLPALRLV